MLICLFGLFCSLSAQAWDDHGHRIVAKIAEETCTSDTRKWANQILSEGETLTSISDWADRVKKTPEWKFTAAFHFVDRENATTDFYKTSIAREGDVVQAILAYEDILRDEKSSRFQKQVALRFLVHFVGDIHQPLHNGIKADKGGNLISVKWFGASEDHGHPVNLHSVWDFLLPRLWIERTFGAVFSFSEAAIASYLIAHVTLSAADLAPNSALEWTIETSRLANEAYAVGDKNLGEAYFQKFSPRMIYQYRLAGERLRKRLDSLALRSPLVAAESAARSIIQKKCKQAGGCPQTWFPAKETRL